MTDTEFRELVREMRRLQREYFKTRSNDTLLECKEIEGRVDKALKPPEPQKEMF